jgi:RNA polymerase sigma-70 factor (ECF subfamily)
MNSIGKPTDRSGCGSLTDRQGSSAPTLRELLPHHLPQLEGHVRGLLGRTLRNHESVVDVVDSVCGDLLAEGVEFEYRGEGEFQAWLRTVVANKIRGRLRFVRAKKRGHDRQVEATDSQVDGACVDLTSPAHHAMLHEDLGLLDAALARLPQHYRELIVRRHLMGEPHEQAAIAVGSTVQGARNMLTRAMVKLAGELDRLQREP